MNQMTLPQFKHVKRFRLFLALSRTPHGVLDMATPAFAALVWLGGFPPFETVVLGLITAFAGYTAVYALNDMVDFRVDKSKLTHGAFEQTDGYLDAVMVRHPLAQGLLSFGEGLSWIIVWAAIAMVGAYLLNPVCMLIFMMGSIMEIGYCLMWNITPFRTVISGLVKTSGAMAAVFAVDSTPSPLFLFVLFFCLFFWEIGGQNIPADWTDIDIDSRFKAQTIPIRLGVNRSSVIVLACILVALVFNALVFLISQTSLGPVCGVISLVAGAYLLLIPAMALFKEKSRENAMALFNRASYYPPVLLSIAVVGILMGN